MVKGCTLGKDSANELMGDFTAAFLVRALWIAVENPAPYFSEFGTLNGYGVSKFTASVCQDNWGLLKNECKPPKCKKAQQPSM